MLSPARLSPRDVLRVGGTGLRTCPLRVFLSALGIAIGIAAMTAVVGVSSSSRAELDRQLAALGTNLLTVAPGNTMSGETATLPIESVDMIRRITAVRDVAATGEVPDTNIYRTDRIPELQTRGLSVQAAHLDLPDTVGVTMADGTWLNAATAQYPAVMLGAQAVSLLGITSVDAVSRSTSAAGGSPWSAFSTRPRSCRG